MRESSSLLGLARCRWRHGFGWPHPRACSRSCAPPLPWALGRVALREDQQRQPATLGVGHLFINAPTLRKLRNESCCVKTFNLSIYLSIHSTMSTARNRAGGQHGTPIEVRTMVHGPSGESGRIIGRPETQAPRHVSCFHAWATRYSGRYSARTHPAPSSSLPFTLAKRMTNPMPTFRAPTKRATA